MFWTNDQFKKIRKKSPILLDDLRVLIGNKCWSSLSRIEAGKQKPTIEVILMYHLIFDIRLDELLEHSMHQLKKKLSLRALEQIDNLRDQPNTATLFDRINYLEGIHEKCQN